jgi:hypothetical protein
MATERELELVRLEGPTSTIITARVTAEGDLVLEGQDVGEMPRQLFDDGDYEYFLTVKGVEKDRLLLVLLKALYGGKNSAFSEFRSLLDAEAIPYKSASF